MSPDRHDHRPPRGTPSQIDTLVGERIRLRREHIGLTAAELAALLGIDESDLETIESGRKRAGPTLIAAAAAALGMPVYWFFVDTAAP
jgi:transcriptional regulator with XRE-family HTH domain